MSIEESTQERRNETDESEQPEEDAAVEKPDLPTMEAETAQKTVQPGDWVVTPDARVVRAVEKDDTAFVAVVFDDAARRIETIGYDEVARYSSREHTTELADVRSMAAEWRTRLPDGGAT